jgi:hypothetical protein
VTTDDFESDARLVAVDRYWNLRISADPTVRRVADCAGWMAKHVDSSCRRSIAEKWGLGFGFVVREYPPQPLREVEDEAAEWLSRLDDAGRLLVCLFHAGRLRANWAGDELHLFLESSALAQAVGLDDPLLVALRAFAAFTGSRYGRSYGVETFEAAWSAWRGGASRAVADVALNGLALAADRDRDLAGLVVERAREVLQRCPDVHGFHARLASGLRLQGEFVEAREHVDRALALLPAHGWRTSHALLQTQYLALRDGIDHAAVAAEHFSAHERLLTEQTEAVTALVRGTRARATAGLALAVAVALTVLPLSTLGVRLASTGDLDLGSRLWLMGGLGAALAAAAAAVVGGVWLVTRTPSTAIGAARNKPAGTA